jgi:hypothetical protein
VTLRASHVLLLAVLLACGKYGPPVRAAERKPAPETKPRSFEVPLPGVAPAPAPAAPEPEREPPPEGSP